VPLNPNPAYNSFPHHTPAGARSSSASASMPYRPPLRCRLIDRSSSVSASMPRRSPPRRHLTDRSSSVCASMPHRPPPHQRLTDRSSSTFTSMPHGPPPCWCHADRLHHRGPRHPRAHRRGPHHPCTRSSSMCPSTAIEVLPHHRRGPPLPPNCSL
jgi:hypothetical protein